MTMKIGQIEVSGVSGRRDAFHVPAILVRSDENLRPGENIRFTDDTYTAVRSSGQSDRHAVADPFVKEIPKGCAFWALLMPDLVSNLVHHFNLTTDVPVRPMVAPIDEYESQWDRDDNLRCGREGCT